jgi:hypothetical protein
MRQDAIARIARDARIPSAKRREVERELRAHFEDSDGEFGDPDEIAREFSRVYRFEWMRARVAVWLLSMVIVASVVTATVLAAQTGLGVMHSGRHAMFEVRDIVAAVAVYQGLISLRPWLNWGWVAVAAIGWFTGSVVSWVVMGIGYYLMTVVAPRVESALRERLA